MKSNFKTSISSRASVRSLIVACLPSAALVMAANPPALGAAIDSATNHDLTVDDNTGASTNVPTTNGPGTNTSGAGTNHLPTIHACAGERG